MTDISVPRLAGAFLVTLCLSYMLFGMLVAQIYYYWLTFKNDSRILKLYVWTVGFLALLHSVLSIVMLYSYFITFFGDEVNGVERINWSARVSLVSMVVFIIMTQVLCVTRIWIISKKSIVITAVPALLVLTRLGFGVTNAYFLCASESWLRFVTNERSRVTMNATFVTSVVADGVNAGLLVYFLAISRGSVPKTTHLVNKLMIYVVNTGAITMVFAFLVVLLFNFVQGSLLFAGTFILLGKMYANTMLAMLNARGNVLKKNNDDSDFRTIELTRRSKTETHVQIYTETMVQGDPANSINDVQAKSDIDYDLNSGRVKSDPYHLP